MGGKGSIWTLASRYAAEWEAKDLGSSFGGPVSSGRGEKERDFPTGHCWATPADPRPGGSSSFNEEWFWVVVGDIMKLLRMAVRISVVVVNCKERYPVKSHLLLPLPLIDLTKSKTCKRPSRF